MKQLRLFVYQISQYNHCVQTDPAKNVWTRAYLIPEGNWTGRRQEEGKNSVYLLAYFSINIRWHSQNVSSDSRKWLIKHFFPPGSCKKQINKQNYYLLLAFLQSGSVPELDMHESKHFLPGQFVHSDITSIPYSVVKKRSSLISPYQLFDRHDITEILLEVAVNTITLTQVRWN
jgi:hypothetical protein